jgi:RNA polymerase sigma factor (TIGR02999 family)
MSVESLSVTQLLQKWGGGDSEALNTLLPLIYDQLRKVASRCLRSEQQDHVLQPTALVNEAYLRLVDAELSLHDRCHFYAIAARVMRQILVDHARAGNRQKRGGGIQRVTLNEELLPDSKVAWDVIAVDDALKGLAAKDQRKSDVIELLFFGGLTYDETAEVLQVSAATVHRELKLAKAYLHRELTRH